jgi:hypothetical protein
VTLPATAISLFADAIARQAAAAAEPRDYCRDLISRANLPTKWKAGAYAVITADAIVSARRLIEWADAKGINREDARYTTVGSVIAVLLDDAGPDVCAALAPTILGQSLFVDRDLANAFRKDCRRQRISSSPNGSRTTGPRPMRRRSRAMGALCAG